MTLLFGRIVRTNRSIIAIWVRIVTVIATVACCVAMFAVLLWFAALEKSAAGAAVTGVVAFVVFLLLANLVAEWRYEWHLARIRHGRLHPRRLERPIKIREARIASDLAPFIDNLPVEARKSGVLRIVGYSGSYISSRKGNLLRRLLVRWIREGLRVKYILTDPDLDPGVEDAYTRLRNRLEKDGDATRDRLQVLCVRKDAEDEDFKRHGIDRESLERLERKHPTLFHGSVGGSADGEKKILKAMWIEEIHEPGSSVAYDVTYVSPDAMGNAEEKEYESYSREIKSLEGVCRDLGEDRESRRDSEANSGAQ